MPAPSKYSVALQDIDSANTARTETGELVRDRVRAGVYKIGVTWLVVHSQIKTITDAITADKFQVTFFDPTTNSYKTCNIYCGDRAGEQNLYKATAESMSLWELTTSLIEYEEARRMYPVSAAYKTAIQQNVRDVRITGTITLKDNSVINITDEDIVQGSLYITEQCV